MVLGTVESGVQFTVPNSFFFFSSNPIQANLVILVCLSPRSWYACEEEWVDEKKNRRGHWSKWGWPSSVLSFCVPLLLAQHRYTFVCIKEGVGNRFSFSFLSFFLLAVGSSVQTPFLLSHRPFFFLSSSLPSSSSFPLSPVYLHITTVHTNGWEARHRCRPD